MRYSDMRAHLADTTKKGKLRKRAAKALSGVMQPPATPARPVTGLDEHGFTSADRQGNVYQLHAGGDMTMRERRRAIRFGRGGIEPMRSRIQRTKRRRRTGGVT